MSGAGLEVLLEGLIPDIAYSGEKGVSISSLLKIVRQYHASLDTEDAGIQGSDVAAPSQALDPNLERTFSEAEMTSARWAWDWLRSRPQILIGGSKRWNRLELSEVLALPEDAAETETDPPAAQDAEAPKQLPAGSTATSPKKGKEKKAKKVLTKRPRIYPSDDLVWQTLAHHGVDYKRIPLLEWQCMLGIASARGEGILQSDLRRLVGQDKRSLPKRTDSLAKKGYIAKRTVVANKMKTSKLWLTDMAPPVPEDDKAGLDLSREYLTKNLEPVAWHNLWTLDNVDVESHARTVIGIVKAWGVIRYCDLRAKMGVSGKSSQMKTVAKCSQRFVDMGVLKYAAAFLPGSKKVFKDCLKFVRDPRSEEWEKFLATGKKTSQYSDASRHREPKANALALYGKPGHNGAEKDYGRNSAIRIIPGWIPEKPLFQTVFEVVKSAGPNGASNPQVSVATVGYGFRRYMASHLTKLAETQQPEHLQKFQVVSRLVRLGKTSAYMFSVPATEEPAKSQTETSQTGNDNNDAVADGTTSAEHQQNGVGNAYGFGDVHPKTFPKEKNATLSQICAAARKNYPFPGRKGRGLPIAPAIPQAPASGEGPSPTTEPTPIPETRCEIVNGAATSVGGIGGGEQLAGDVDGLDQNQQDTTAPSDSAVAPQAAEQPARPGRPPLAGPLGAFIGAPGSLHPRGRGHRRPTHSVVAIIRSERIRNPSFLAPSTAHPSREAALASTAAEQAILENQDQVLPAQGSAVDGEATPTNGGLTAEKPPMTQSGAEEAAPMNPAPARGRGRGRGHGRGGAKAGGRLWRCEKCGGTWKNDVGYKYHITKSQTPCNPNFNPALYVGGGRKRRRSPVAPTRVAASEGEVEDSSRPREKKRQKTSTSAAPVAQYSLVRSAIRAQADPHLLFRGFALQEVDESGRDNTPPTATHIARQPRWSGAMKAVQPTYDAAGLVGGSTNVREPSIASVVQALSPMVTGDHLTHLAKKATHEMASVSQSPDMKARRSFSVPEPSAFPTNPPATHGYGDGSLDDASSSLSLFSLRPCPLVSARPSGFQMDVARRSECSTAMPSLEPHRIAQSDYYGRNNGTSPYPMISDGGQTGDAMDQRVASRARSGLSSTRRVFQPSTSYDLISSESKRKTAQALDVILYLLDNNCGVFPAEKALFYALTKAYLKEFRGEVPPTYKNCHAAVRLLETRKLAAIHTHMLRTEKGKLSTCSLLIRNDVDPAGMIPMVMKQKMRDAYPGLYIPPAFSPTQEELALLEQLEKPDEAGKAEKAKLLEAEAKPNRNGQKFRSRRKIDEVEVFNAPYYTQALSGADAINYDNAYENIDPTLMGVSEQSNEPKQAVPIELTSSPSTRRRKIHDEFAIDPALESAVAGLEHPLPMLRRKKPGPKPGQKRAYRRNGDVPQADGEEGGTQSVVDAITTYNLLPAKTGKRKWEDDQGFGPRKSGRMPSRLGRVANPGLDSLPKSFYSHDAESEAQPMIPPAIPFLRPNSRLNEVISGELDAERVAQTVATANAETSLPHAHPEQGGVQPVKEPTRVFPAVLEDRMASARMDADQRMPEDGSLTTEEYMPDRGALLFNNMPASAEEMCRKYAGPSTETDSWIDREWAQFWELVEGCKNWELSEIAAFLSPQHGSVGPGRIYINVSPSPKMASMKPVKLRWAGDRQFSMDTLPYESLDGSAEDGNVLFTLKKAVQKPARKMFLTPRLLKRQRIARVTEKNMGMVGRTKFKLTSIKTGRELTPFPQSAQDFLRRPTDEPDEVDWESENVRLTAFVVITTLLGGVDRVVDWGLMMRLFPDLTISQLRHLWGSLKKDRQSTIVNLTAKFRRAFLQGYADGQLPTLDYNNILSYDWKRVIKWATGLDGEQRENIPASREEINERFVLDGCKHENREWRESYFHMARSVFNKFQDATSEALASAIDRTTPVPQHSPEMTVALSWTRSLCVTPIEKYSTDMVVKRREKLYPELPKDEVTNLVLKGIEQLQREGVISRSTSKWSNGRRWRFNNRVFDVLDKVAQVDKLFKATEYKRELDEAFRSGDQKRVTYITNDGMMLALINLQACGRVRVETTGQQHVPMGHEPGNYETRKYTKKYLHFRLDVVPTESYIYDDHPDLVESRKRFAAAEPPLEGPQGAIPVWCDVFRQLDTERWFKYLAAVLLTIASRGSMRADELVKTLKPAIMHFEAEMILGWAMKIGLLEVQVEGMAPAVKEWWWLVLDAQKERIEAVGKPRKMLPSGRPRVDGAEGEEDLF